MEPITITTPSGHSVTIKPALTFGESRQLERVWAKAMQLDATTNTTTVDGSTAYDAQDAAVKLMVLKIELTSGETIEGNGDKILQAIMGMDRADGLAIYTKINELTNTTELTPEAKKK